jgi:2-polyprenyl-3-methyl-5-hydroxy-6-metoxy-1,4-benzoquinol methylase
MNLQRIKRIFKALPTPFSREESRGKKGGGGNLEPIPRDWKEERLLAYLLHRYGTNRKYTDFYMKHMLSHHKENPLFDLYMESELGSLKRSRVFMESLCHNFGSPGLFRGKECLDVGSSAGNSLIAFIEGGARRAAGIEISLDRFDTAAINIQECRPHIRAKIQMIRADIQDDKVASLGQFDIIFCTDVLEHVSDLQTAIGNLCRLLKNTPEAFVYVKLRNYQHPENVLHEPHYDLPGMVLLPPEWAHKYFDYCQADRGLHYEVNEWKSFFEYQALFQSFAKECSFGESVNPEPSLIPEIERQAKVLVTEFDRFQETHALPQDLEKEIRKYLNLYLQKMQRLIQEYQEKRSTESLERFYLDYGIYDIILLVTNKGKFVLPKASPGT